MAHCTRRAPEGPAITRCLSCKQTLRSDFGHVKRDWSIPGAQEILGLSHEQKLRIVNLRCRFLGCMREVLQERGALQAALARPIPVRYDGAAAMNVFAEASVDVEARVQALVARQGDAFRLMMYGVREASPAAGLLHLAHSFAVSKIGLNLLYQGINIICIKESK